MEAITFTPLYMQRVWGGRELERVYGRTLPEAGVPYGESWEISDRANEQSVVDQGPLAGTTLHDLWTGRREELFGTGYAGHERFPLLIKVLDARDDLSIQVHPPASKAAGLGGDPKTEMWFIADATPGATLYAGLKQGVSRTDFESAIHQGSVETVTHAITPAVHQSIFIPSGRLHAIGAGFLIHEIQQNSDTTYRVFDWNRAGLDGKARELHIRESMASIDFDDFEPAMDTPQGDTLACCEFFHTRLFRLDDGASVRHPDPDRFCIVSVVEGTLLAADGRKFPKGSFLIQPRGASPLTASGPAMALCVTLPT